MVRKRKNLQTESITKKEYIQQYANRAGVSVQFLKKLYICLPCYCPHIWCKGFVLVDKHSNEALKRHYMINSFYKKRLLDLDDFGIEFESNELEII